VDVVVVEDGNEIEVLVEVEVKFVVDVVVVEDDVEVMVV